MSYCRIEYTDKHGVVFHLDAIVAIAKTSGHPGPADIKFYRLENQDINEICNDPDCNRINEQHAGFIIESDDAGVSESLGWAIERHLNDIPTKLKLTFRKIL